MKVLCTGSSGLIGTPLVRELASRGHEVVPYDIADGYNVLDIYTLTDTMAGCDTVVHLAAISFPRPKTSWIDFWRQNCVAVQRVASAARACGVRRLIFTSSTAYYGFERDVPVRGFLARPMPEVSRPISQTMRPDELDKVELSAVAYIQSKVIAENILAFYGLKKLIEVAILRLCPVRGTPYLGLYVYNENVTPALVKLVETDRVMWYEVFNFANPEVTAIDTFKWDDFWGDEWQYC